MKRLIAVLLLSVPALSLVLWQSGCGFFLFYNGTSEYGELYLYNGSEYGPFNFSYGLSNHCFNGNGMYDARVVFHSPDASSGYDNVPDLWFGPKLEYRINITVPDPSSYSAYHDGKKGEYSGWCDSLSERGGSSFFLVPSDRAWCSSAENNYGAEMSVKGNSVFVGFGIPGANKIRLGWAFQQKNDRTFAVALSNSPLDVGVCLPGERDIYMRKTNGRVVVECV